MRVPRPTRARPRAGAVLLALAVALGPTACGGGGTTPTEPDLPAQPVPLTPAAGSQVSTDTPPFTTQNARGYDSGQAEYTFVLMTRSGRQIGTVSVPAGRGTTAATFGFPIPRGMTLTWMVRARGAAGEVSSATITFRGAAVSCSSTRDNPYGKSVVAAFLNAESQARNSYTDPDEVLGRPDAGRLFPGGPFFGFFSLGCISSTDPSRPDPGYVIVDTESCAVDGTGADVRVFQAVSNEPVTLYVAGAPNGPFLLAEARKTCGARLSGVFSAYCDFDLASAEVDEARYFRIEDGELFPCALAATDSEGADIDAIQLLSLRP